MLRSVFDLEGISKLIFKNASGEILFTQDMTDQKIMNTSSSKHQQNKNKTEQDSVKSNFQNTQYLILKSNDNEFLTFARVQPGSQKSAITSSNPQADSTLVTRSIVRDIVFPDSEDILCYQIRPEDEIPSI